MNTKNDGTLLLSVIVPAYNAELLIGNALKSLVNQKFAGGDEVIVVNDGSKDDTLKVISDWQVQYPQLIRVVDKPNGGVSSARNAGIEAAKGEWIFFCDADDYIAENSLENLLLSALQVDPDADLINFAMKPVSTLNAKAELTYHVKKECTARDFFRTELFWCSWLFFFKRKLIIDHQIHFQNLPSSEDTLFNIDYLLSLPSDAKVIKYDTLVYFYYSNPLSVTRLFDSKKSADFIQRFFSIFEFYNQIIQKYGLEGDDYERMKWVMAKCVPNFFARMIHSSLSLAEIQQLCSRMVLHGVLPFTEVTKSPLTRTDRVKEFMLLHPFCFMIFRWVYKRMKGYS